MVTIREAQESELRYIASLWSRFMAFNAEFNESFKIKNKAMSIFIREMKERRGKRDSRLAVAELDGKLAGFCYSYISVKPEYFSIQKFGFIGDLFVREEFRRRGIGRRLVEDALSFFHERRIRQIELLVAVKNENTIRFWENLGFDHLLTWMYKRNR